MQALFCYQYSFRSLFEVAMPAAISVIIPTFRRPIQLAAAIDSVLSQDVADVEIIVVDDCVKQSSRVTVEQAGDPRIRYVANPKPSGGFPSVVRNYGIGFAEGSLVHFLDDDDIAPSGHYTAMKSVFDANPNIGVVFGRVEPFGDDPVAIAHEKEVFSSAARRAAASTKFGSRWGFSARLFFSSTLFVCGAAMIRRACIAELGGFDPRLKVAEDVDFFARAIRRFGACYVDRVTLLYRIWESSLMHTPSIDPTIVQNSYRTIHARYRKENGSVDYLLTKILTRTLLRLV
jgi:glycosyltransferase involved in cell wall biosynthesis